MKRKIPANPFPTTVYLGQEYFCDREEELNWIRKSIENGMHISLVSLRRMGKTGLIHHVLSKLSSDWHVLYVDVQATETLNEFFNEFVSSALRRFPEKTTFGRKLWQMVKSFRPTLSFDSLTGSPQVSMNLQDESTMPGIESVLQFLDDQDVGIVIAVDEFQQVLNYPEGNVEAWLRSKIQRFKNIRFIFSGSMQHIMTDMFNSPSKPFYRSTQMLHLHPIPKTIYADFIVQMFLKYKKEITHEVALNLIAWCRNHTYYVQFLCNRTFASSGKLITDDDWQMQAFLLLKEQENVFFGYRNMLTKHQWNLLNAIAREGKVFQPTAKKFISDHNLPSSAGVLRALNSLLDYELIVDQLDDDGKKYYQVYDVFFARWLRDFYK